ncbi:MAG: GNAT family N-acetyltransferase [Chloroflexota bacterium]
MTVTELDAVGRAALAALLPDTPENVISRSLLHAGRCRAWRENDALLIESDATAPGEPHLIGSDPAALLALLRARPDWRAANLDPRAAAAVAEGVAADGITVRPGGDLYFVAGEPPEAPPGHVARLLRGADRAALAERLPAFAAIDPALGQPWNIGAASFAGSEIVSLAAVTAQTPKFANVSIATLPEWRDQGHGVAAAAVLVSAVVRARRRALWSCGETNAASLRIARSLGFTEAARRVYLVRERRQAGN